MKNSIFFIFLLFSFSFLSQDITVSGATFKKKLDIKGDLLTYNGAGLRQKYGFDLYVSALYLPAPSMDPNRIINADELQAINIKILVKILVV